MIRVSFADKFKMFFPQNCNLKNVTNIRNDKYLCKSENRAVMDCVR